MSETAITTAAAADTSTQTQVETSTQTTAAPEFFGTSPKEWAAHLPDDLKDYKSFEKYPTTADFLRGHRELEKTLSSRKDIKPPGEGAKPEDIAAWNTLIGVPKTPEEYGIKAPEKMPEGVQWNEESAKEFAAVAHKAGVPASAVPQLLEFYNGNLSKIVTGAKEAQAQQEAAATEALKKEWGEKAPMHSAMAVKMMEMSGLDPKDPAIGNNPALAKAFHNMAETFNKLTSEDSKLITGDVNATFGQTAQAAYDKIANSDDFMGKNGIEKQNAALAQMQRIHEAMNKGK